MITYAKIKKLCHNLTRVHEHQNTKTEKKHFFPGYLDYIVCPLIALNFIALIASTYPSFFAAHAKQLLIFEIICTIVFVVEITIRIIAEGSSFWKVNRTSKDIHDPKQHCFWNYFDFSITAVTTAAFIFHLGPMASMIRVFRCMRVFTLMHRIESLDKIANSLFKALKEIVWVMIMLLLVFSIYAVIGCFGFNRIAPEQFGNAHLAFYSLFKLMTLDGWATEIAGDIIEARPWSWVYFVSFIFLTAFVVLNIITGAIVDAMDKGFRKEDIEKVLEKNQIIMKENQEIMKENQEIIKKQLDDSNMSYAATQTFLIELQEKIQKMEASLLAERNREETTNNENN